MRIFHLVPNLNYGGLQEVVRGLALCQRQAGHAVTIGCWTNVGNHPELEADLQRAGVLVEYLRRAPNGERSYGRMPLFRKLSERLGSRSADILHVHNPFGYYLYGAMAARFAGGTRIINTVHATAMFDHKRFGRKGRVQFWAAAMLSHRLVSVCSEVEQALCVRFSLPRNRLSVVENGINLDRFLDASARRPSDQIVFGAVGRMSPEKNHRVLFAAFALAHSKHSHIRLRLLGGGPLEPDLKALARSLGVEDVVEFCGFSHDVVGFLGTLDVFVLPSSSEGLPLSLLEAIASGLPVVATAVGGVPRIVQNTGAGWLCAPDSADALRAAMESAIASPDPAERAEKSRRLVAKQYSAERMARDYERVYQELLQ